METDTIIRLGAFLGVFAILSTAEVFVPRRRLTTSKSRRWFANLTIVALNPLSVALVYPVLPIGVALLASEQGWGLLNQWALPYGLEVLIGVAALDLVVYTQHVLHHAIPVWEQGFKNPPKTSAQNRPSSHLNIPLRRWRKPKSTELCWRFEAQTACIF